MSARTKVPARPTGMIVRNFRLDEVDPRTLVLDPCNVRDEDVTPTPEMLESVAQDGVDTPVIVRPLTAEQIEKLAQPGTPAPEYGVLAGQQRWLSSIEAVKKAEEDHTGWFALPIVVRDDLKGADRVAVARSLVENTRRKAMTPQNEARAAAQLAAFSMTPTERKKAARSVGLTPEQLKAAKTAAAMDEAAFSRAADRDFDFYQAAQYDEVKDVPGALDRLGAAAGKDAAEGGGYGHWEHAMASLRQRSQTIKEQADLLSALRADKVTQVDRPYEWRGTKMRELTDLVSGMGRAIDPAQHVKDCPGRAFYLGYSNEVVPVCADWKKNGHQLSPEAAAKAGVPADAEEAKAANRLVRTNNEAFKTATTVRRTALKAALKEKPGDASWALLRRVAREMPEWYAKFVTNPDRRLMAQLLGAPEAVTGEGAGKEKAAEWLEQAESRMGAASSSKLLLAQVFAAYEARVMNANKVWASPNGVQVELLVFMRDHLGYKLSDIEAEMVAHVEGAPGGVNAGPVAERLADPEAGDGPVGEIEGATAPEGEGSGPDGAGGSAVDGPADASLGDDDAGGTSAAAPDADGEQRVAGAA